MAKNPARIDGKIPVNPGGRPRIQLDDFDKLGLTRLILGYYKRIPPTLPTLDMIHSESQSLPGFPRMSRATLHRVIKRQGFVVKKRNKKMMVYQRMDVVAHRHISQEYNGLPHQQL